MEMNPYFFNNDNNNNNCISSGCLASLPGWVTDGAACAAPAKRTSFVKDVKSDGVESKRDIRLCFQNKGNTANFSLY